MNYFVNVKKQPNGIFIYEVLNGYTLQVVFSTNSFMEADIKCKELNFKRGKSQW